VACTARNSVDVGMTTATVVERERERERSEHNKGEVATERVREERSWAHNT
jgi:hypothetical protein